MELIIKKRGFTMNTNDKFKGEYSEYGEWTISNDTLTLNCKTRKNKFNKKSVYTDNHRKEEYGYEKTERYFVLGDRLCPLLTSNRGKGFCFMKK